MTDLESQPTGVRASALPTVTIVFLVYNRRDELRTSLRQMIAAPDYDPSRIAVVVVDNASDDGSAEMVDAEFPDVQLIRRDTNCGVSGWNDGFAVARGDYVLALDDDCYLPDDGLSRALAAAQGSDADLVSFAVRSEDDPDYRFNERYRTGLLTYWGCAVLMRRRVVERLRGYDPEIFVWANELEFMVRFFDAGFRHLHMPEIVAVHMKRTGGHWTEYIGSRAYMFNSRHFAYVAGKLFKPRDALEAIVALLAVNVRDAIRVDRSALNALSQSASGFVNGLRHRSPVDNPAVSGAVRRNLESFASPWWVSRPPLDFIRDAVGGLARLLLRRPLRREPPPGRRELYYEERGRYHPASAATLDFREGAATHGPGPLLTVQA